MKYTVLILVVLGIVAAMCAVLLFNAIPRLMAGDAKKHEIDVLVATRSIAAHTELTKEDMEIRTIDLTQEGGFYASEDAYYKDPIYLVGKTVSETISVEQPITKDKIITDPDRATILKALKPGMRAYPVRLTDDQIVGGLLAPGCFVDALVTFNTRAGSGASKGEAVSRTFLERIKVIAVKGELAQEKTDEEKGAPNRRASRGGGWTVTLLVDTVQAEALQLATERGRISLTLRNPLDDQKVNSPGTVLDTSKVGVSSMFFDPPSEKEDGPRGSSGPAGEVEVIRGNKTTYEGIAPTQESE